MNRWRPDDFERREPAFGLDGDAFEGPAAGLLITCTAECFPPAALTTELAPGAWIIHRTPGNVAPPFGAGYQDEEKLLERAVSELRIGTLVVCGHYPCAIAAHLLEDGEPADDFVLRDWLSHAEAARRVVQGHDARAAAAHNVLAQLANLRTHPAVAVAVAQGRLQLWTWLHAGELLGPSPGDTVFDRPVALHPDQNRYLRRERVLQRRPQPSRRVSPPYLA